MNINIIKNLCTDETIEVTPHILLRFQQRHISYSEIKQAILFGEVIEDYPDDYSYPSCLILGKTNDNRILHVVVGLSEDKLWLITAYIPDPTQWSDDFRKRNE